MSIFQDALIRSLTMESVQLDTDNPLDSNAPEPEGDGLVSLKLEAEAPYNDEELDKLDRLVNKRDAFRHLSAESTHRPWTKEKYLGNKIDTDNYVVNGVFIPDMIDDESSGIKASIIRRTTLMSSLNDETVYFVIDDDEDGKIAKALIDEGFYAANNALDFSAEIERLRNHQIQTG